MTHKLCVETFSRARIALEKFQADPKRAPNGELSRCITALEKALGSTHHEFAQRVDERTIQALQTAVEKTNPRLGSISSIAFLFSSARQEKNFLKKARTGESENVGRAITFCTFMEAELRALETPE